MWCLAARSERSGTRYRSIGFYLLKHEASWIYFFLKLEIVQAKVEPLAHMLPTWATILSWRLHSSLRQLLFIWFSIFKHTRHVSDLLFQSPLAFFSFTIGLCIIRDLFPFPLCLDLHAPGYSEQCAWILLHQRYWSRAFLAPRWHGQITSKSGDCWRIAHRRVRCVWYRGILL